MLFLLKNGEAWSNLGTVYLRLSDRQVYFSSTFFVIKYFSGPKRMFLFTKQFAAILKVGRCGKIFFVFEYAPKNIDSR